MWSRLYVEREVNNGNIEENEELKSWAVTTMCAMFRILQPEIDKMKRT